MSERVALRAYNPNKMCHRLILKNGSLTHLFLDILLMMVKWGHGQYVHEWKIFWTTICQIDLGNNVIHGYFYMFFDQDYSIDPGLSYKFPYEIKFSCLIWFLTLKHSKEICDPFIIWSMKDILGRYTMHSNNLEKLEGPSLELQVTCLTSFAYFLLVKWPFGGKSPWKRKIVPLSFKSILFLNYSNKCFNSLHVGIFL